MFIPLLQAGGDMRPAFRLIPLQAKAATYSTEDGLLLFHNLRTRGESFFGASAALPQKWSSTMYDCYNVWMTSINHN